MSDLVAANARLDSTVEHILDHFENGKPDDDLRGDLRAWRRLSREIRTTLGPTSLDRFLQELALCSKEPAPVAGTVSLATIHGAKGLEFETVYLVGLAEEVLPSWHSIKPDAGSAVLEEERRGCFVAITRTKERLVLSRARRYKGWSKPPSRFLTEMGLLNDGPNASSPAAGL